MKMYLSAKERKTILSKMTKKEQKVLSVVISKRHRSNFDNLLAKYKGTKEWSFYRYIDHGEGRKTLDVNVIDNCVINMS